MEDIMKIVKPLRESSLLINGVSETNENESKEQKGGIQSMLLGILRANLLGNLLSGKRSEAIRQERGVIRGGEGAAVTSRG